MRNKKLFKATALALASSLVITGGDVALNLSMAKAQEETIVKEVESTETVTESITEIEESITEQSQDSEDAPLLSDQSSEIQNLSWEGHNVTFIKYLNPESGDLTLEEALKIAKEHTEKFSKQSTADAEIQAIFSQGDYWEFDMSSDITNKKHHIGPRCYYVDFNLGKNGTVTVELDSITGEVFSYSYFHGNDVTEEDYKNYKLIEDGFTEQELGYGPSKDASNEEVYDYHDNSLKNAKSEYSKIAADYIKNSLGLGTLEKTLYINSGSMNTTSGEGNRIIMLLDCSTSTGDVVELWIDQIDKEVYSYTINPDYEYE